MKTKNTGYRNSFLAAAVALAAAAAASFAGAAAVWVAVIAGAGIIVGAALVPRAGGSEAEEAEAAPAAAPSDAGGPEPAGGVPSDQFMIERLNGELAAAREIQMRLVPHSFPPLRGCPPFDLYAMIEPAREIGGDFYDYWMVGRDRLVLVIADVSGKGVPAALYMAMTRTYLRAFSRSLSDPAELLTRLNSEVARHNPGHMFVTVFCAVVDLGSGVMEYAGAGHNPPLRCRPGKRPEWFELADNPAVGFMPDLRFVKRETRLEPGEMLFLYTDGVTEAANLDNEQIGEEKVEALVAAAVDMADTCRSVTMNLHSHLSDYAAGREQYDDITIMTYRHPDSDDWTKGAACDGDAADIGDSALNTFAGTSLSLADAAQFKFFSLTDLK